MDIPTSEASDRAWADFLLEKATRQLDAGEGGILLSAVPSALRSAGYVPEEIFKGNKLSWFMQRNGSPELQILQHEINRELWIVLPGSIKIDSPPSSYFPKEKEKNHQKPPKFSRTVWRAFVTVLQDSHFRFINLSEPIRFYDVKESNGIQDIPIDREYVRIDDLFLNNATVVSRIEKWAAKNSVDLGILTSEEKYDSPSIQRGSPIEQLVSILSNLERYQQERISIPADILVSLSR